MDEESTGHAERRIYRLAAVTALLTVCSFIVPRFVPEVDGGFASGAMAVLALLLLLGIALVVSIYLLGVTIRQFAKLTALQRLVGITPCLVLTIALVSLLGFVRY